MTPVRRTALALLALAGCADEGEPPPPVDDPPPEEEVPAPIVPARVTWSAEFGWDGGPVPIPTAYGVVEPRIVVTLADARWDEVGFDRARTDLYCDVALPLTDAAPAAWVADDPRLWHGVDWTGAPPTGTCGDAEHPVEGLGGDPLAWVAQGEWGVAIGDLSPNAAAVLGAYFPATYAAAFGGTMRVGPLGPPDEDVYGLAWALDPDGALRLDEADAATLLDPTTLDLGGDLARAGYWLYAIYVYDLEA